MGIWADVIKVIRSSKFKKELSSGNYSIKNADYATSAGKMNIGTATTANKSRGVWFSDSDTAGKPIIKANDFSYNPITKSLFVPNINGKSVSSFARISAGTYVGDGSGQKVFGFNFKPYLLIIQIMYSEGESSGEFSYYMLPRRVGIHAYENGMIWAGENDDGRNELGITVNDHIHYFTFDQLSNTITIDAKTNVLNLNDVNYQYFAIGM